MNALGDDGMNIRSYARLALLAETDIAKRKPLAGANLYCICGTRTTAPDALREHQLACTRTTRARRRLAPMIVAKIRALQARL